MWCRAGVVATVATDGALPTEGVTGTSLVALAIEVNRIALLKKFRIILVESLLLRL